MMELEAEMRDLECGAENQQQRVRYYQSIAIYTILAYITSLRFFYSAVSPASSTLHCVHWPLVSALTLSCSFLYFFILLPVFIKLHRTHNLLDVICKEHADIYQRILNARSQHGGASSIEAGASPDGVEFNSRFHQVRALHNDSFTGGEIKVYACAIAVALLSVTAFELCASKYVLCN